MLLHKHPQTSSISCRGVYHSKRLVCTGTDSAPKSILRSRSVYKTTSIIFPALTYVYESIESRVLIFTHNQMKRKAAFVEEEDSKTGEAVLGTESSASIFLPPEQSSERRKTWRRSGSDFVSDLDSTHLGTVLNVVEQSKNEGGLLTVVAGEHEDNAEVWKECKNAGTKFRLFALKGRRAPTH